MELRGEQTLAADRDTAWAMLNDIDVLKLCVPGCESIAASGHDSYEIQMTAAVGPVKARFKGRMALTDVEAPHRYTLRFDGQSSQAGFARGQAQVELQQLPSGETQLIYLANAQVGGKLAQVGSRLIDAAAGATADKFFEAFAAQLAARTAPAGAARADRTQRAARVGFWSLFKAFLRRLFGRH